MMYNATYNTDNAVYSTRINGTSNMTTIMLAPMFASKGHYYQIATDLGDTLPIIKDHKGAEIKADANRDDTFLGIE